MLYQNTPFGKMYGLMNLQLEDFLCDINDYITYRLNRVLGNKPKTHLRMKVLQRTQSDINRKRSVLGLRRIDIMSDLKQINNKLRDQAKLTKIWDNIINNAPKDRLRYVWK